MEVGPKPLKRKILNSYFISTLSITLVLFLVGLMVLLFINVKQLNSFIRENIGITLVLSEDIRQVDLLKLQKLLSVQPEVKSVNFVDAETAAQSFSEELGEDFVNFLEYNPLSATMDVKLYASYTRKDSISKVETKFINFPNVEEVYYQRNLVSLINSNSRKISLVLIALAGIMLLMFSALINNTIRLSIYSKRFIINTMQLVGATRNFIRKPFVLKAIFHGLIGALLANVLLVSVVYSYYNNYREMFAFQLPNVLAILVGVVFFFGIIISWLSTIFAVNKFLRLRYDELFY